MQLAFYKASRGTILDWVIDACSERRGFSHVELVFSDGICFSASMRDGGTRFAKIDFGDKWEMISLCTTEAQEKAIRSFCRLQCVKKYDYLGVLGFVLPTRREQLHWFCSEVVAAALQAGGMLINQKPWKISPNDLHLLLTQ